MSNDIEEGVKSFVLGMLFPAALVVLAVPYLAGHDRRSPKFGVLLSTPHALAYGTSYLSLALCFHALFFRAYDNHQGVKYRVLASAIASFGLSLWLWLFC